MSVILLLSILFRLIAFFLALLVWRRLRDWRIGFLALMLLLMAVRQSWTLSVRTQDWHSFQWWAWEELPGLAVSVIALLAVFFLERMLSELKRHSREEHLFHHILRHAFEESPQFFNWVLRFLTRFSGLPLQSRGAVWLKEDAGESYRCVAALGENKAHAPQAAHRCPLTSGSCENRPAPSLQIDAETILLCLQDEANHCHGWMHLRPKGRLNEQDRQFLQRLVMLIRLILQHQRANRQLKHQARHDALTGLYNRYEFQERLQLALETIKQSSHRYVLCYFDLDQFKLVNDACSHAAGDALLHQVAQLVRQQLMPGDCLARLGGDEFALLLRHCDLDQAVKRLQTIRQLLNEWLFMWKGHTFHVSASFGVVLLTPDLPNAETALSQADAACFMAKDHGRNQIQVHRSNDLEVNQRYQEMNWANRLEQALKENRFCLYAQPIVPVGQPSQKQGERYEILLRLRNPGNNIESPGTFLPAAERYHLMPRIDRWVICHALTLFAQHSDQKTHFSINLSGQSLGDPEILALIREGCKQINASHLCFEITETAAITNLAQAQPFLSTLKSLGCRLALDDFGTGVSSYAYLKRLPIDYLKIDGQFVRDLCDDPVDLAMVRSINEVAHILGKRTVAEFVESQAILAKLAELGVDYAQGYFIGRPVPLETVFQSQRQAL